MSLRSVNCKVNQIFPASFTFSMETVQASYCMGVLSFTGSHDSVVQNPFLGKIALCRKS